MSDKINQIRILPKGQTLWSITNQTNFITTKDEYVKILNTCWNSSIVFVKPQKIHGWILGGIDEHYVDNGKDEWMIDYNHTIECNIELRKGILFLDIVYSDELKNKENSKNKENLKNKNKK